MAELQKVDNAVELNFDELYDAGYSNYDIAKAVGVEFDKDLDGFIEQGGNVDDFLYTYTNVAPPGSIGAFTDRLFRGITKSGPTTAGIITGAKVGSRVPVGQPFTTLGTTIAGGVIGSVAGEQAVDFGEDLGVFETRPPMRQDRFAAIMGDVVGEGLPLVFGAPFLMQGSNSTAGMLVSKRLDNMPSFFRVPGKGYLGAEKIIADIGKTARGEKGKAAQRLFYGVESSALGASAVGGAVGESVGGDTGQLVGEITGGMFEPRILIARHIPNFLSKISGKMGTEAREVALGTKLRTFMEKYGEDPDAVVSELESAMRTDPARVQAFMQQLGVELDLPPLTPDQITGSPVLKMLRQTVAKRGLDQTVTAESVARAEKGFEFIEQVVMALRATGDPDAIRAAANIQADAIESIIINNLQTANNGAQTAARRLGRNDDFDVISLNLKTNFDQIITNANAQEAMLWNEVPQDMEMSADNLMEALPGIKAEYFLETEDFPGPIAQQIALFRQRMGMDEVDPADNPAVIAAQKSIDNMSSSAKKDYEDVEATILDPDKARLFRQGPEVDPADSVEPDLILSRPVRVIDAIRARRAKLGSSISPAEKTRLNNAERVAEAQIKLIKAGRAASLPDPTGELDQPILVRQMTLLRSRALEEAKIAMKDGDRSKAKALGKLANAILEDLDVMAEGADDSYDVARAFSRGKNDALRRTFLGDIMARDKDGGDIYEPTLLHLSLFDGGADATAMRFREIQDGAGFVQRELDRLGVEDELRIPLNDVEFGPVDEASLNSAMAQAVQYAAAKVIDADTGRINPKAAAEFIQENEMLLRGFPQIRTMLEDGKQFEDAVKLYTKQRDEFAKVAESNAVLAKLVRYENPRVAISEALGHPSQPITNFETIIRNVKSGLASPAVRKELTEMGFDPDLGMDGLRSAMIEWMWTKHGGSAAKFSPSAALQGMFKPLGTGRTTTATGRGARTPAQVKALKETASQRISIAQVLKREGVFTQAELDRLEYLLERGQRLEVAMAKGGKTAENMVDEMGGMADLLVRLAGARFGTDVANVAGLQSNSLITGGAGVRFFRSAFGKVPEGLQLNLLEKAVLDPEFMVKLLKKGGTPEENIKNMQFLNAYLVSAGLSLGDEDDVSPGPDIEIETPLMQRTPGLDPYIIREPPLSERIDQILNQTSMAPAPPAAQPPAPSVTSPTASLAQATPPPQPDTRRRMAAAFPGDGIMGLMGAG